MEFFVKLIKADDNLSKEEKEELDANCTFIKNNIWIFEGDEVFLDARFTVLSGGVVGPLGGLSQEQLVGICKATFIFDESLLEDSP